MRYLLDLGFPIQAVAHLVGFLIPWKLVEPGWLPEGAG